ncbi:MAG: phage holin family protein [Candidatus Pristimantibacillus sp.]
MEWNAIFELIKPELFIVVAACWVIGFILKQTPQVPNWIIVYVVTAAGILIVTVMLGFNAESVLQGLLCGAVAVYGHQLVKQVKDGADKDVV